MRWNTHTDGPTTLLLTTSAATALFHTLIPDHWLPFVLIGRALRWAAVKAAAVSGLSALIHVLLSLVLGALALGISVTAAKALGETLQRAGGLLLILFGVAYALWAWRNRGHFHPGGALLHRGETAIACAGEEGDANPEHLYYHADRNLIQGRTDWSAVSLAVIVGINPCVLVLPLMLAGAARGPSQLGLVILAYSVPTVLLMVGLSVLGVLGGGIRLPLAARHMEVASGLAVAALGVLYWLLESR